MNDIRFALRQLARAPGFAVVAILTLALGIGLSASSFSMANAFLLRNVPYPDADRLVRIFATTPQSPKAALSPGNALELRDSATSLNGIALYNGDAFSVGDPGQPAELVSGLSTTANFLNLLQVQPTLGRGFVAGEDAPDQPRVAIITHRAWVRRYAADPAVIGRTVRLNTEPFAIIGVLPPSFDAPLVWGPVDFIIPQIIHPTFRANFKDRWLQAVARLQPATSPALAQSELSTLAARLRNEHPNENAGFGLSVVNLFDSNMDTVSRSLLWLMTAISLTMLLIACANLASLQVARAFGRSREFAIRAALGGGRRQLMAPLFVESLLLAVAGGIGGLFIASWSNDIIGHFLRINNELGFAIPFDARVFAFAAFAALLSGVAFGLAPAWLAARAPAAEALKEGSRGSTTSRSHQRLKNVLIVGELALALALVGVAASFGVGAKSFMKRQVGWEMNGIFAGYLALPYNQYNDGTKNRTFQRALLEKLTVIPGVEQAVICNNLPIYALGATTPFQIDGRPLEERGREPTTQVGSVTADFFTALKIPLKTGAFFSPSLTEKDPDVAIVNEAFAKRFWPGESAVGRRVRLGDSEKWIEIIGVVGDVRMLVRFDKPETALQLYRPAVQAPNRYIALVLRSTMPPETLARSVREAVASLDADLPVANPGSLYNDMERNLSNLNLVIINLGISAGMGLLIAGVGLFGVISQLTMQRTRDIGVRLALGAQAGDIMSLVIGGGLRLLAVGMVIGIPGFFALNAVLRRAMPEMQLPGLWFLALNLVVLAAAMLLACYLPARRATRISPVDALRSE